MTRNTHTSLQDWSIGELRESSFFERHPGTRKALIALVLGGAALGAGVKIFGKIDEHITESNKESAERSRALREEINATPPQGSLAFVPPNATEIHIVNGGDLLSGKAAPRKIQLGTAPNNLIWINDHEICFSRPENAGMEVKYTGGDHEEHTARVASDRVEIVNVNTGEISVLVEPYKGGRFGTGFFEVFGDCYVKDRAIADAEIKAQSGVFGGIENRAVYDGTAATFRVSDLGVDPQSGTIFLLNGTTWYKLDRTSANAISKIVVVPETIQTAQERSSDQAFSISYGKLVHQKGDTGIRLPNLEQGRNIIDSAWSPDFSSYLSKDAPAPQSSGEIK